MEQKTRKERAKAKRRARASLKEKANMGTWRALASPFSFCLSRIRQSWGACDSVFPLPVEERDLRGTLQGSMAGMCTGLRRALKGSAGLRRAARCGIAFPVTGTGKRPSQARLSLRMPSMVPLLPAIRSRQSRATVPHLSTPLQAHGRTHQTQTSTVLILSL